MKNCIFCKIIKGEISGQKIYEDKNSVAVLDAFPNTKAQALLISKKHLQSDFTEAPDRAFSKILLSAKKISAILKEKLKVNRIALVIEGTGVNHFHIKLYPMHNLNKKFKSEEAKTKIFYKAYPGFIDTRAGNQACAKKLKKIADLFKN